MTTPKEAEPAEPRTLADAQHAAASNRPQQKAPLTEWLSYHQRCAAWYAEVAEIDRGHHHEALAMAERERQLTNEIMAKIASQESASDEVAGR